MMKLFEIVNIDDDSKIGVFMKNILKLIGIMFGTVLIISFIVTLFDNNNLTEYIMLSLLSIYSMIFGIYIGMCKQMAITNTTKGE